MPPRNDNSEDSGTRNIVYFYTLRAILMTRAPNPVRIAAREKKSMHSRISFSIWWMSLVFLIRAINLSAAEENRKTVALTGARLLDGTGHDPVDNTVLVIEGDKISAVGPAGSVKY